MPDEVYGDAFEKLGGCIFRRPVSIPVPFVIRSPHVSPNVPGALDRELADRRDAGVVDLDFIGRVRLSSQAHKAAPVARQTMP
jgi:hypothetical protein